jgi:hypothetical protein
MGLFGKKKESEDILQTQEIKQATTNAQGANSLGMNPTEIPIAPNMTPPNVSVPDVGASNASVPNFNQEREFVNPFANADAPSAPEVTAPSANAPSFNSNIPNASAPSASEVTTSSAPSVSSPNVGAPSTNAPGANISLEDIQEQIDETVEKIIEERWQELTKNVQKVISWKGKVEQEIDLLKQDIGHIKEGIEAFEKKLMNKLSTYDGNILDVNSEIKALEKVFQKITPTLVNNVNELSEIADKLRGIEPKKDTEKQ